VAEPTVRGDVPVAFDFSGRLVPKWTGGALVVVDHLAPAITLHAFGREGRSLQRVPLDIPGGSWSMVGQFARGHDGTLAVIGSAYLANGDGGQYIGVIPAGGQSPRIFKPVSFHPEEIAIASDGVIWIAGEEMTGETVGQDPDHRVIRRFSPRGSELSALLPRSELKPGGDFHPAEDSALVTSDDRVGWYSRYAREYIEFALDGRVLLRAAGVPTGSGERVFGIGLCDDGTVYAGASFQEGGTGKGKRIEIFQFDRSNSVWTPITLKVDSAADLRILLVGCDANQLVTKRGQILRFWRPADAP
jgi:hypothetical protein